MFQNIPQMQNRYPDNQWEEILGGCDFSIFLGCNDMTTAEYYSKRTGGITVSVASIRKNYNTIRATNYVPEYTESSSVGKRELLMPDEVLRYPLDRGLLIIRGQKVYRFQKMDYTQHPDAKRLRMEKVEEHIPEWYQQWQEEQQQTKDSMAQTESGQVAAVTEECEKQPEEMDTPPLMLDMEVKRTDKKMNRTKTEESKKTITKVEDLFAKHL